MTNAAPPLDGSAGSVGDQQNNRGLIATPAPTAQLPPKPHVCRAVAAAISATETTP